MDRVAIRTSLLGEEIFVQSKARADSVEGAPWRELTIMTVMRMAVVAFVVVGCGTRQLPGDPVEPAPPTTPVAEHRVAGEDDAGPAPDATPALRRAVHLAVVVEPAEAAGESAVSVAMTDETGAVRHVALGAFPGRCVQVPAISEPALGGHDPVLAIDCAHADGGARIRLVHEGSQLIVLRAWVREGGELSYNLVQRIELPVGAAVTTGV